MAATGQGSRVIAQCKCGSWNVESIEREEVLGVKKSHLNVAMRSNAQNLKYFGPVAPAVWAVGVGLPKLAMSAHSVWKHLPVVGGAKRCRSCGHQFR